ncbi:polyprenyl diphosphate synthase [Streptomyces sp. NPDC049555]|uniref:polyprenyl diphosphate synthase n=1 Tax=Streptomyces sp. NPDC049555 TaxID=3154930 RepID=UPI00341F49A2
MTPAPPTPSPDRPPTRGATVPGHLAVILDGNRRWAEGRNRPLADAYEAGAERVRELLTWSEEAGIRFVTVWALSRDNLCRPPRLVEEIVQAIIKGLWRMAAEARWPIKVTGSLDLLPHTEQADALRSVERRTADAPGSVLTVAVAYDGRRDIVAAAAHASRHPAAEITEDLLASYLSTAGHPDIDLLIRTSGEMRLSGFMPWQSAHAELYFTPVCWPDFDRTQFDRALAAYAERDRRYGL